MIPIFDLKLQQAMLKNEINTAIATVLDGTQFIMGTNVRQFEKEVGRYLGVKYAITCNSGTDALHLTLRACGIGENDEVITTPFSFVATAEAICHVGATPVFVDIDPITFNITAETIQGAITEKTRAILPVHIFGQAADMRAICKLADQHNLLVIEDCAQSFGAGIGQQKTGSIGDAGCFSFFPTKNLGCYGDGGLFTTNSDELAEQFSLLKNHGRKLRNQHQIIGWNSRLDELQAAILRIKLRYIDQFNQQRIAVADHYCKSLAQLEVQTPIPSNNSSHVYHQYTVLSEIRDAVTTRLLDKNIGHAIYYPMPLPEQQAFTKISRISDLTNAYAVCAQCISLPMFPEISESQIEAVVETVAQTYAA